MFLKVEINGKEDFYSFKGQEVVKIGRSPVSDIQIINDGVSRNHIEIREESGDFFIYDRGSTNGTFINDEELQIDEQYPFNSFFPVRLGFEVFIYLLDEVSVSQLEVMSENSKRKEMESFGDLTHTSISTMAKMSNSGTKRIKRGKKKVEKVSRPKKTILFDPKVIIAILVTIYFLFEDIQKLVLSQETHSVAKEESRVVEQKVVESKPEKVADSPMKKFNEIITSDKCLDPKLDSLCNTFKSVKKRNYYEGLIEIDGVLYIVIDPISTIEYFKINAPRYNEKEREFALLRLARDPKFQNVIMPTGRYEKNNNIDVYKFNSNKIEEHSQQYYQLAQYSEVLFSNFGKQLKDYPNKKVEFIFYKISNNEYRFKSNNSFEQEILNQKLDEVIRNIKFALFNGENELFRTQKRKKTFRR